MNFRVTARILVLSVIGALSITTSAFAASVDYFLKIDGIEGESTSKGHEKWIDLESFNHALIVPAVQKAQDHNSSRSNKTSRNSPIQDIVFTMNIDKATPMLLEACATGRPIPTATLDVVTTDEGRTSTVYLQLTMSDCLVSSFSCVGSPGGLPTTSVTISCSKVKYSQRDSNGNVETAN